MHHVDEPGTGINKWLIKFIGRDTHIMLFEVPIMLCSNSQHQANYAHCFAPIMLSVSQYFID